MIVLAIGLLGIAALQAISLKNNQDAYFYSQANALAYEMGDLIKANKSGWKTIPTLTSNCSAGCNSRINSCTVSDMAASDYCDWQQKTKVTLVNDATTAVISPTGSAGCSGSTGSFCLTITWPRINTKGNAVNSLGATASYQLVVTP
jgi:type IV pilus assembly protein PilV